MSKHVYRVTFVNQSKLYELYAATVQQSSLYGFIEVSELIFEPSSSLLVDPAEEKLRSEFQAVETTMIPVHSVIRIDRVEQRGRGKITEIGQATSNVMPFPGLPPRGKAD